MFDTDTHPTDFYITDEAGNMLAQQRLENGTFGQYVLVDLTSNEATSRPLSTAELERLNSHSIAWWGVLVTDHPSKKTFLLVRARLIEGATVPFGDGLGQTGV